MAVRQIYVTELPATKLPILTLRKALKLDVFYSCFLTSDGRTIHRSQIDQLAKDQWYEELSVEILRSITTPLAL